MELDKVGQKLTAEFVGTFALVFVGSASRWPSASCWR